MLVEDFGLEVDLDAGTADYYHFIDRTPIPFQRILDNITEAARVRPLVIQSLFMRVNDEPPSEAEQEAFCERLNEIAAAGGQLSLVQVYTVARRPAEDYVQPLSDDEVDALYNQVYSELLVLLMAQPEDVQRANYLLWAAHNIERFGDRVGRQHRVEVGRDPIGSSGGDESTAHERQVTGSRDADADVGAMAQWPGGRPVDALRGVALDDPGRRGAGSGEPTGTRRCAPRRHRPHRRSTR